MPYVVVVVFCETVEVLRTYVIPKVRATGVPFPFPENAGARKNALVINLEKSRISEAKGGMTPLEVDG